MNDPSALSEKACMTVSDVADEMRISRPKAYELTHRKDFPAIRVGKRIVIPRAAFYRWLEDHTGDCID